MFDWRKNEPEEHFDSRSDFETVCYCHLAKFNSVSPLQKCQKCGQTTTVMSHGIGVHSCITVGQKLSHWKNKISRGLKLKGLHYMLFFDIQSFYSGLKWYSECLLLYLMRSSPLNPCEKCWILPCVIHMILTVDSQRKSSFKSQ